MTMLLQWRQSDPPIVLGWRGPDGSLAVAVQAGSAAPAPTIIGPPGVAGPAGPQGPVAEIIDGGTFT
jgi:hypothetical protein